MMKILITAGPTREKIDPVRYITNRSTGKMGYALARAAVEKGLSVTLISGPVVLPVPGGLASFVPVESASEMADAVHRNFPENAIFISCAAVADFRPKTEAASKIKKTGESLLLELEPTEDILKWAGQHRREDQILVGFAAETELLEENAKGKLERKNLDWIAANRVGTPGEGFASDTNAVILFSRTGKKIVIPLASKEKIAEEILKNVL